MAKVARHGWSYSIFGGAVACPIAVWFVWSQHGSYTVAAVMIAGAIIAARCGAWLAVLTGNRDHGWTAGAFTGALYLIFCGALVVVLFHSPFPGGDAWDLAYKRGVVAFVWYFLKGTVSGIFLVGIIYGSWTILPACIIGTALYQKLLSLLTKADNGP